VNGLSIPNISSSNDLWLYENENPLYNTSNIVQDFTHHLLLEAHFDPSMLSLEGDEDKPFTWNDVILSFGDGTVKEYNIGEIHFNTSKVKKNLNYLVRCLGERQTVYIQLFMLPKNS